MVVLPAPLAPTSPIRPRGTSIVRSSSAVTLGIALGHAVETEQGVFHDQVSLADGPGVAPPARGDRGATALTTTVHLREHMFVNGEATILHADLDAFFASVEQRDDPSLRGRPVIVGIGVVMCASYEARARGVRGAMGGGEARRLCPDAVFVPPRLSAYTDASKAVFEVFDDTTPFVEGISVDEAFLDVGGLRRIAGTPEEIAVRLRAEVRDRVGLPISVGVARTKFLAKVASAVSKPDGLLVVPPADELGFLHPLPIERVWGIGAKTAAKLHARGIHRVGDIAALPEEAVVAILGRASGHHVHALSRNRDARRVQTGRRRRSIGSQRALGRSPRTAPAIDTVLVGLVDRVDATAAHCRAGSDER